MLPVVAGVALGVKGVGLVLLSPYSRGKWANQLNFYMMNNCITCHPIVSTATPSTVGEWTDAIESG
jgi:hypothetical protein